MQQTATKAAVATHLGALSLIDSMQHRLSRAIPAGGAAAYVRYRAVWLVLVGIFVVAAAAGFAYCRAAGHNGFTGNVEALKGPFGVKIGVKIECT